MRILCCLLCAVLLCTLFVGCTPHTDHLAPLRGGFSADVSGEMNGVAFSALVESVMAADGAKTLTLTFYAPTALADTAVKRAPDGAIAYLAGEVTVAGVPDGILPLFDLFDPTGEVADVALTEEGHTLVTGDGFSVTFLADGTPYLLENDKARVTVVRFETV